jgi:hypothetical protein
VGEIYMWLRPLGHICSDWCCSVSMVRVQEELKDIKGVIRICKSKKDRQHNGQKKKNKRTNNDLLNIISVFLNVIVSFMYNN